MAKGSQLRDQSKEELVALEKDKRKELFELRNKSAREKKLENPQQLRNIRKEIARILTVLREKELENKEAS